MKKIRIRGRGNPSVWSKFFRVMKLTYLFFLIGLMQLSASAYSQSTKLNLKLRNTAVVDVLEEIEKQSEFRFAYSSELIDTERKVSVKINEKNIEETLEKVFKGTGVKYVVKDRHIMLYPEEMDDASDANAQQVSVKGVVTDETGETLPGVTVYVKGTTKGTVTGIDGDYSFSGDLDEATLVFSFVGMITQEIPVNGQTQINVQMAQDAIGLDEVVVTALGIKKSTKALSYSISEVDGESIVNANEISAGSALIGKIAGVDVTSSGRGVAGASKIRIRGNSSLTSGNEPLYIVDGVPMDNSNIFGGDALSTINPEDIETMSVLKGNSASALYGSRAANGVVMITTKNGSKRKGIGVEFSTSYAYDQMINVFDERQTEYGVGLGGQKSNDFGFETHRAWGAKYDGSAGEYPDGTPTTYDFKEDHIDEFYNAGNTFTNNIALTGGNDVQTFRFSLSNMTHSDIVPNSEMDRNTFAISTQGKYGKKLTVNAKLSYSNQKVQNRPSLWGSVFPLLAIPTMWEIDHFKGPTDKLGAKEDGTMYNFSTNDYILNPYWSLYQNETEDTRDKVIASALARYDFTDWLYIQGKMGIDFNSVKVTDIAAYGAKRTAPQGKGRVKEWTESIRETNYEYLIGINKAYNDFKFDGFFGGNTMERYWERDGAQGEELQVPYYHVLQNASSLRTLYGYSSMGINSLFGSAEVSYKNFLYLNATGRKDWFSTMPEENNSVFYPSVGVSFVLSEALTLPELISFGKLRASWASVGGGAPGPYSSKFSYGIDAIGHMGVPLASISNTLPNPDLKPYLSKELELGMDVRFFNGRLGLDYAYYNRNTTENITNIALTTSSGYSSAIVNLAEFTSFGHEIMISATPVKGRITWDVAFNYSYNMSEVVKTGSDSGEIAIGGMGRGGTTIKHIEGEPAFAITTFTQVEENGQKVWQYDAGRKVYGPKRSDEREIVGYGFNPHGISLSNSFAWNNLNLDILIDGKFGGSIYSEINERMTARGHHLRTLGVGVEGVSGNREDGLVLEGIFLDQSGNPADLNAVPAVVESANFENFYRRVYSEKIGGLNVYDASYLKLRQITLGYNLPQSIITDWPVNKIHLSVFAKNLFNLIDNLPNSDPAFADTQSGNIAGLSEFPIPSVRSYGIKLNVGF